MSITIDYIDICSFRDDISCFSLTTREDDKLFSSFVNSIVLATIHAQEKDLTRERSQEMPYTSIFGSEVNWALRDAISYSGSFMTNCI